MSIAVFGVFIGYMIISLLVLVIVVIFTPKKKWKLISGLSIVLISILIPTWDILIGRINFNHLCETQAGQFIYKQISLGNEYYLKARELDLHYPDNSQYAYASGGELNLERVKLDYVINTTFDRDYSRWGHIFMRESTISSKQDKKILSRAVSFYYRGGWVMEPLLQGRSGQHVCPENGLPGSKGYIHRTIVDKTFRSVDTNT